MGSKVVVYGLSTEGYSLARQMAMNGADVSLIDESAHSAISLKSEIAKTYPSVPALKEDEPLLAMEPIEMAISKAQYVFFTPRIRRIGQDTKTEIHARFKDTAQSMKKNSSMIYNVPTGFGGNNENVSLLEHVTGFEAGRSINYFYYPISENSTPAVIGTFNEKSDKRLAKLLSTGEGEVGFVGLSSSEHFHAIDVLTRFGNICSVLEVCKFVEENTVRDDLTMGEFADMFIDDMIDGIYDLRALGASFEGANTLMYLINGSQRCIDGYVKRLVDEVRGILKKYEMKASKTKIAVSWTLNQYEMRGEKIDMKQTLTARLRDYIGDVEAYEDPSPDFFHSDKKTIVVSCSKSDYDDVIRSKKEDELIIIKANPMCESTQ